MTKRTSLFTWLAITASILSIPAAANAKTIHVDADAAGVNDGTSWENAYYYLQDALADANDGDEIRVAQGVYRPDQGEGITPGDRGAVFTLKSGVTTSGGYAGYGSPDPSARDVNRYKTILSGDLAGNDVAVADPCDLLTEPSRSENSEHILMVGGATPVLDGFTVTSANCSYSGGGIVMSEADLVVTDCVFTRNSAGYCGGAMTGWNSQVVFERCSFIGNAAAGNGGAVFMDCCTCRDGYLGCVDCKFINNSAGGDGGAICIHSMVVTLTSLMNCLIVGNKAWGCGSALDDHTESGSSWLVNCTLSGNWAKGNTACDEWGYSSVTLVNSILSYNEGPAIRPGTVSYLYSFPACATGEPRFVSPGYWDADELWVDGDYHLQPTSPLINAGDPEFSSEPANPTIPGGTYIGDPEQYIIRSSDRDLDGVPRVVQGRVDMGSYEHQLSALVAHWKLDESEGNIAQDSAGTNDGVLHGSPLWLPNEGRVDGALLFDGQDEYVDCGDSSDFDITGQITVAAWVRINAVNMEWQTVIAKGDSAWRLSTARDEYRYCFAVTGGPPWNYISGDTVVAANEWHHVCGTYDGEDLRLYIDGVEDPAGPVPEAAGVTTDEYDVVIGENQERPGRYWDGMIDDVRIYNYALPALEVAQLAREAAIYVDDDAPNDPSPGDPSVSDPLENGTEIHPFDTIQEAIDAATNGDIVFVAPGTYREYAIMKDGVSLQGAGAEVTIIDGYGAFAVVFGANNCRLDGFTITGYAHDDIDGVHCEDVKGFVISNNIIKNNSWSGIYSLRSSVVASNNLILNNMCAGIFCDHESPGETMIINNTICGNRNEAGINIWHGVSAFVANNIITTNTGYGGIFCDTGGTVRLMSNNVWGNSCLFLPDADYVGCDPGESDISVDPLFADPNNNDYHLKSQAGRWDPNEGRWTIDDVTSPCIDAGDPMSPIGPEPFPNGGIINMGAYGGTAEASKSYFGRPPCETIVAGDINGDCEIDFRDFLIMALHWCEDNNL